MTRVNKIVMHGFKSFAKHTEILFDKDFNCIVGPNGSGKSNVLDAICFVLGKSSAKGLRAEKSSNLVYNGGKTKSPSKWGKVSIHFDNSEGTFPSDEEEVKISRIVQQNGSSKYKINDKVRTRQEVIDTLAVAKINPDGYNIVLQGDIIKFVELGPVEKRKLIEEVAGISVYDEKREKAGKELEKVEGKLSEADIVLKERDSYLKDLKVERDQAMEYKELSEKIRRNKASYLKKKIDNITKDKSGVDSKIDDHKKKLEDQRTQIQKEKEEIEKRRDEVRSISNEVEVKGEREQVNLQKEIEQDRIDVATMKTRVTSHEGEIQRIKERRSKLQENVSDLEQKIATQKEKKETLERRKERREKEKKEIDEKIAAFKKKHKLDDSTDDIEKEIDQLDADIEKKQAEIQKLRERQQEVLRQQDRVEYEIQTTDERIAKVKEVEEQHKKELEDLKNKRKRFKEITLELNKKLDQSSGLAAEVSRTEKKLQEKREELAKLEAKNSKIREKAAGNMAVQKILEKKKEFQGVYGTVAELGSVKSTYAQALEVAAGNRLRSIVVKDDATAAKCIKYLKQHKLGTANFLPLNKLKPPSDDAGSFAKAKGVYGRAIDLITFDAKFKKAFQYVFGNTIVVESIDAARRIGVGNIRMATLTGDVAETSGAMQGGYREQKSSVSSFQEQELSSSIENLEKEVSELETVKSSSMKRRDETDEAIARLREEKANLEGEIIKIEKGLHLDSHDLEANQNRKKELKDQLNELNDQIDTIMSDITTANKELAQKKMDRQKLKDKLTELRNPRLLAELNTFEQRLGELKEEIIKLDAELQGANTYLNETLLKDLESSKKVMKDIDKEEKSFTDEIATFKKDITGKEKGLKEKEKKLDAFYKQFKDLFKKRSKINEEITEKEKKISGLEEKARNEEQKINTLSLENAKYSAQLESIQEEYAEYEGVEVDTGRSEEDLKKEVTECEKRLEKIGNVNLRSLEIYDQVEREYNNLMEKKEQLLKEKDDVSSLIEEIEGKKKQRFMETLTNVNTSFVRIFTHLSSKGEAYLEVENEEDPLSAGLYVRVKISGSKFMDIRSLSGGEKTLTALAFIFAMQEFEPATFYVLDEVDAALDKRNAEKLADLIKQYSDHAQYVVISHNDAVVNEASTLYGVSMDEHGISKIVSLKI